MKAYEDIIEVSTSPSFSGIVCGSETHPRYSSFRIMETVTAAASQQIISRYPTYDYGFTVMKG